MFGSAQASAAVRVSMVVPVDVEWVRIRSSKRRDSGQSERRGQRRKGILHNFLLGHAAGTACRNRERGHHVNRAVPLAGATASSSGTRQQNLLTVGGIPAHLGRKRGAGTAVIHVIRGPRSIAL